MTGKACSPNTVHWTYDTHALSHGTGGALVKAGGDSWFFLTADYAFGQALERDTSAVVVAQGGKVAGSVKHPLNTGDLSSFLLQAQSAKTKVIALANAGADTINAIKQASEFGITENTKLVASLFFITDVHGQGLKAAHGLVLTEAYYWDLNDEMRAFAKTFAKKAPGRAPPANPRGRVLGHTALSESRRRGRRQQVGNRSGLGDEEATDQGHRIRRGSVREDGHQLHDTYLFEVKSPRNRREAGTTTSCSRRFPRRTLRPLSESTCPFLKK